MLERAGLDYEAVAIAGEVRVNISIVQPDGVVTKINERGPALSDAEGDALLAAAHTQARAGGWVAGCGSLPGGLADGFYARLVETGHRAGARVVIDTSGAPLVAALAAGPDLIKPNADELADAVGGAVTTVGDVVDAAQELRARGAKAVLASLGGDGAVLVTAAGRRARDGPRREGRQHRGAGDALLAGYLSAADDNGARSRPGLGRRRRPAPRHALHHRGPPRSRGDQRAGPDRRGKLSH
jgi:1-phosphofructokinase